MGSERALGRITILSFTLFCQQLYGGSEPFTRATLTRKYKHHLSDIVPIIRFHFLEAEDGIHSGDMVATGN